MILKAEKITTKTTTKEKKSVSENYLTNDKIHFVLVFVSRTSLKFFFLVSRQVTIILRCSMCVSLCYANHCWLAVISNVFYFIFFFLSLVMLNVRVRHSMKLIKNCLLLMFVEL